MWQSLIQQRCGLYFSEGRLEFMQRRLWDRMRVCRFENYTDYYRYVAHNLAGDAEWAMLLDLLLNLETGFFRHQPSYQALADYALPKLLQRKIWQKSNIVNMWSVGCSTGQEAYSLAMVFLEVSARWPPSERWEDERWQIKVTGSDLSESALQQARRGKYISRNLRQIPELYRQQYLLPVQTHWTTPTMYEVVGPVRDLVEFSLFNLRNPGTHQLPAQDIIFCQNVLIYFKPECRTDVVRWLGRQLNLGGYLFLAPTDAIGLKPPSLRAIQLKEVLLYQRIQ